MASQPNPLNPLMSDDEPYTEPLASREGWKLIYSLFGSSHELYAKYGGGEAALRAERAAWGADDLA